MHTVIDLCIKGFKYYYQNFRPRPEGKALFEVVGHRNMVGGLWEQLGEHQFKFMISQGLKPHHVFLDVGCGSLRGGRLFIPYLHDGNYLGIEKEKILIETGKKYEIPENIWKLKKPEIIFSDRFEFGLFSKTPNFAIAQSLFTHLSPSDIRLCLRNLANFVGSGCRFFATFSDTPVPIPQIYRSHSSRGFIYTHEQMKNFGESYGLCATYIGEWEHPRGQKMMEYVKP